MLVFAWSGKGDVVAWRWAAVRWVQVQASNSKRFVHVARWSLSLEMRSIVGVERRKQVVFTLSSDAFLQREKNIY